MPSLFGFLDAAPYEQRKVGLYRDGELMVSTVYVNDSNRPYETAIQHPEYNRGKWIVVQCYDTRDDAVLGHESWVVVMTCGVLPESLKDVSESMAAQFGEAIEEGCIHQVYKRVPKS